MSRRFPVKDDDRFKLSGAETEEFIGHWVAAFPELGRVGKHTLARVAGPLLIALRIFPEDEGTWYGPRIGISDLTSGSSEALYSSVATIYFQSPFSDGRMAQRVKIWRKQVEACVQAVREQASPDLLAGTSWATVHGVCTADVGRLRSFSARGHVLEMALHCASWCGNAATAQAYLSLVAGEPETDVTDEYGFLRCPVFPSLKPTAEELVGASEVVKESVATAIQDLGLKGRCPVEELSA